MSQQEKYGFRDQCYSAWHRINSIRRYVGIEKAQLLAMIDLDAALFIEYDDKSREPLVLIEAARDVGQSYKTASVIRNLARRADLHAFVVLYTVSDVPNPAAPECGDISGFRVQRLWPEPTTKLYHMSPQLWSETLVRLREEESARLDLDITPSRVINVPSAQSTRSSFRKTFDQRGNGKRVPPLGD